MFFCHIGNSKKWSCTIIFNRNSLLTIDQSRKQKENFCNSYTISNTVLLFFFLFFLNFFSFFPLFITDISANTVSASCPCSLSGNLSQRRIGGAVGSTGAAGRWGERPLCARLQLDGRKDNTPSAACLAMGKGMNSQMERLDFKLGKPNSKCK